MFNTLLTDLSKKDPQWTLDLLRKLTNRHPEQLLRAARACEYDFYLLFHVELLVTQHMIGWYPETLEDMQEVVDTYTLRNTEVPSSWLTLLNRKAYGSS